MSFESDPQMSFESDPNELNVAQNELRIDPGRFKTPKLDPALPTAILTAIYSTSCLR